MSKKIIKASEITGEYRLKDIDRIDNNTESDKNENKNKEKQTQSEQSKNEEELFKKKDKIIKNAEKEAEKIVARAESQAQEIIEKAENKAKKIKEKSHDDGYQEGFKEGKEKGKKEGLKELQEYSDTFNDIIENFKKEIENKKQEIPNKVINLSIKIASKIVATKLEIEPQIINNVVSRMLNNIDINVQEITVKVNSKLYEYLNKSEITQKYVNKEIKFQKVDSLEKGDCIIETDYGGKDGTLENKLQILKNKLLEGAENNEFN